MGKVIWSPTAYKDIDLVAEYIAKDSPDRASQFVSKLTEQTDQLKSFPRAGRRIPEINENSMREIIYSFLTSSVSSFAPAEIPPP